MAGSAPSNSQAVDFEKQQAAEADAKEAQRQQRLTQGQAAIDAIFDPQPVMTGGTKFNWSTLQAPNPLAVQWEAQQGGGATLPPSGVPAGYTAVPEAGGKYGLQDAAGKTYNPGDALMINQTPTGKTTGGFDDAFYNNYKQKVLDYYQPDEERQYDEAKRDLTFNLARSGNLYSSTAADKTGELAYQDSLQKANIVANANAQEGNLKNQIQANKESLINQLYATEDPTLTANLAESSAKASQLQDPNLTPAAALFTPALTSVGSAVNGLLYPGGIGTSAFANNSASPTPVAAGTPSSKLTGTTWG